MKKTRTAQSGDTELADRLFKGVTLTAALGPGHAHREFAMQPGGVEWALRAYGVSRTALDAAAATWVVDLGKEEAGVLINADPTLLAVPCVPNPAIVDWCRRGGTCPPGAQVAGLKTWHLSRAGGVVANRLTLVDRRPPGSPYAPGLPWYPLTLPGGTGTTTGAHVDPRVVRYAWAFTLVCWSVSFRLAGSAAVRVPVTTAGLASLFAQRDTPATGLRAALRHWAKNCCRLGGPAGPDVLHLRVAEEFDWLGFRCRVYPPAR